MEDNELFCIIRQIAGIFFDSNLVSNAYGQKSDKPYFEFRDWRNQQPDPGSGQTKQGICLELDWYIPNSIWTPWGAYNCWGSGSCSLVEEGLIDFLTTKAGLALELLDVPITKFGSKIGPIYGITSFRGKVLPKPILRDLDEFISFEASKEAWKKLSSQ